MGRFPWPGSTRSPPQKDLPSSNSSGQRSEVYPRDVAVEVEEPHFVDRDPFAQFLRHNVSPDANKKGDVSPISLPDGQNLVTGNIRYTKFSIGGIPGEKHAVFISDRLALTPALFEHIVDFLNMQMPSMMLCGVSSLRHPGSMTTPELRECPAFSSLMGEARHDLGLPSPGGGSCASKVCETVTDFAKRAGISRDSLLSSKMIGGEYLKLGSWCADDSRQCPELHQHDAQAMEDFANRVMEKKLHTLVQCIASAAAQTNTWTFTGPQISNFEIFLQRCFENRSQDLVRTVAAHMQDKAYMENKMARDMMKQLIERAEPLGTDVVEAYEPLFLSGDLWNPDKNTTNQEFCDYGYDYWSFQGHGFDQSGGHPILQWPWPWADIFFLFYRERSDSEVDWSYTTPKKLDTEAISFTPEILAPPGYVVFGGETAAKKWLLQVMQVVHPTVVVDNTPGVAKQFSLLLHVITKVLQGDGYGCRPFLRDGTWGRLASSSMSTEILKSISPGKILKYIEKEYDVSGMDISQRLSLSDIVGVLDLVRQRPQVFRETIRVVDPLRDIPEQVVNRLSSTFCSPFTGVAEQAASPVNSNLVLKGWHLHSKLVRNAEHLRHLALGLELIIAAVMLFSTMLAVTVVYLHLERDRARQAHLLGRKDAREIEPAMPFLIEFGMKACMLLLPVSGGILMTLQTHFQFFQKWAQVNHTKNQVVAEIYTFLGGAGRYAGPSCSANRQIFLRRLQDLMKNLSIAGIREDDFSSEDHCSELFTREALQEHIDLTLYGVSAEAWLHRKAREAGLFAHIPAWVPQACWARDLRPGQNELKDLTAPLNAEMYMSLRIAPLMAHYRDWSKRVAWRRTWLNVLVFLLLGIGSGLAAFKHSILIPVIVVAVLCVASFIRLLTPQDLLVAVNTALTTLHNLDLQWHGSQMSEQRSEAMKIRMISTTEKVVLAVASTMSRIPFMPDDEEEDVDEDGESGIGFPGSSSRSLDVVRPVSPNRRCHSSPSRSSAYSPSPHSSSTPKGDRRGNWM